MATSVGPAALLAIIDYTGVDHSEFSDWYDTEHTPERKALAGFSDIARFVSADGAMLSVALYELADIDVLATPEYVAVSGENYSPWSKRIFARTRRFDRFALDLVSAHGPAGLSAGAALVITMAAVEDGDEKLGAGLVDEIRRAAAVPGVLAARYYRRNADRGPRAHVVVLLLEGAGIAHAGAWGGSLGFLPAGPAAELIREQEWFLAARVS